MNTTSITIIMIFIGLLVWGGDLIYKTISGKK